MPTPEPSLRPIRLWLWSVAALVFLMVIVGGATRLTESGLSIVEWKPVTGTLPPLTQAEWQAEFEKYQAIPQYQQLNRGMSLEEFKTIFWWEWGHRLLGRLVGAAFLIPFLWFLWRGAIRPGLRGRLWAIFALGAAQGGVGWWMVASGLADRIYVSHYRLAFHLTLACVIYAAVVWTAERLDARAAPAAPRIRAGAIFLAVLTLVQIYLGALVAGLRAGMIYDTWPLIEGRLIPPSAELFFTEPWWVNLFENALTVQFNHRMAGYLLWIVALAHAADAWRQGRGPVFTRALLLFLAMTVQAALGIFTLLYHVPLLLALAHQGVAMIVLTVAIVHWERVSPAPEVRGQAAFAGGRA